MKRNPLLETGSDVFYVDVVFARPLAVLPPPLSLWCVRKDAAVGGFRTILYWTLHNHVNTIYTEMMNGHRQQ